MIQTQNFNHYDASIRFDDIKNELNAESVGEILAFGYTYPKDALRSWIISTRHNEVMLSNYNKIGIAIREDINGRKYYVVLFAKT